MTSRGRSLALAVALAVSGAAPLAAQSGRALVAQGIAAYTSVEYDVAAALLARGIAAPEANASDDSARAPAYMYLGAAELYRGRWQAATEAFDQALAADPRHRPDTLVFSPDVTQLFEAVRRESAYASFRAVRETTIVAGQEAHLARVYSSAPHRMVADLLIEGGGRARGVFSGAMGDSVDLRWNGLDSAGAAPLTGRLVLRMTSWSLRGERTVTNLPLAVTAIPPDTLPHPATPPPPPPPGTGPEPETGSGWPAVRALAVGALGGLAAVALPRIVSAEPGAGASHYVVGGAIALAGIAGFVVQRPTSRPSASAPNHGEAVRIWRRRSEEIRRENAERRKVVRLLVTAGNPEPGQPW